MMKHLAVVGSGITGAASAYLLKLRLPQVKITVLDKARGSGGRMCTSRSNEDSACTVDLGAQYITKTEKLSETQQSCYDSLINAQLLRPLNSTVDGMHAFKDPVEHFICAKGSGSIPRYFLDQSGAEVCFGQRVTEVIETGDNKWKVKMENSSEKTFDGVIIAIPVPQVLQIKIQAKDSIAEDQVDQLKAVKYNSRYALGYFFSSKQKLNHHPYIVKYFKDSSSVRFISFDHAKRGVNAIAPSVVVHSTKEFGATHLEETSEEVLPLLENEIKQLLPDLPASYSTKIIRWRYSQVEVPFPGEPGYAMLSENPLLICGGDGFSKSSFEGCIFSAEKLTEAVASHLN